MKENVRVRFAPSPTGYLHVGGARTALYNWLFARHHGGTFILRIEDTDPERSTEESAGAIMEGLSWLGLDWDEGPYRQAERLALYRESAERLLREGKAYCCVCTPEELEERRKVSLAAGLPPKYDGRCRDQRAIEGRPFAIRFRMEGIGKTIIEDLVHGRVEFDDAELEDFVLLRSDGTPTYNFAVVIDDVLMEITHVIRGDDHLSNTPKQIKLYEGLGFPLPRFAHLPMILGPDKSRLSKRHGATSVQAYRDLGYLPEAMINYLVRLGWSHGDQEIFSKEELVRYFTLEKVGKTPAVFDPAKLLWLNGHYIKQAEAKRLTELLFPFWEEAGVGQEELQKKETGWLEGVVRMYQERAKTLRELAESSKVLLEVPIEMDPEATKLLSSEARTRLQTLRPRLEALAEFTAEALETLARGFAAEQGAKLVEIAQPLRVVLTGRTVSPPIFVIMEFLGRERCLRRLKDVLGP
ncbi:MAG: glutamate--tRNA ligase [candidate division NC10 bacterium]|nr:glutamate--tRNA ligase [candidate division NC10 bacterium]